MNDLVRRTSRTVRLARDYIGVCNICGGKVGRLGDMVVIELEEQSDRWLVVPIDQFYCPHCEEPVGVVTIWKSLNVTAEFGATIERH